MRRLMFTGALLVAATCTTGSNPNLRHFSLYGAESGLQPKAAATWVNFLSTSANATEIKRFRKGGVGPSLWPVLHPEVYLTCGTRHTMWCSIVF